MLTCKCLFRFIWIIHCISISFEKGYQTLSWFVNCYWTNPRKHKFNKFFEIVKMDKCHCPAFVRQSIGSVQTSFISDNIVKKRLQWKFLFNTVLLLKISKHVAEKILRSMKAHNHTCTPQKWGPKSSSLICHFDIFT